MAYTEKQAEAKARQIHDRFGDLIHAACAGSGVADSFLAGFTGVEAGIDSHGQINPNAVRFEPGVYQDLISLRDNGFCFIGGKKHNDYSGVLQRQVADASDDAIHALSTSYGCSQIMGWHVINNLKCSIADLRDTNKHFGYTVKLLKIVGGAYLHRGDLTAVLHIWNTGNANGKTYHEDYVTNALNVKKHYDAILAEHKNDLTSSAAEQPAVDPLTSPTSNEKNEGPTPAQAPPDQAPPPTPEPVTVAKISSDAEDSAEKQVSGIQASTAGAITFVTTTLGGIISFLSDKGWQIILGIAVFGTIFVIARFWYANREKERMAKQTEADKARAHELQMATLRSAMDPALTAVTIAPL